MCVCMYVGVCARMGVYTCVSVYRYVCMCSECVYVLGNAVSVWCVWVCVCGVCGV